MGYMLTRQVAKVLDVSERTVRNWEAVGKLAAVRAGQVRLFDARHVERLRRERQRAIERLRQEREREQLSR